MYESFKTTVRETSRLPGSFVAWARCCRAWAGVGRACVAARLRQRPGTKV